MKKVLDEKILEEANSWIKSNHKVALVTVIKTWGSSPRQVGSKMIINENGDFSGSVSGGCVESSVIEDSLLLIKENRQFKKIELKVSDENAWELGAVHITQYLIEFAKSLNFEIFIIDPRGYYTSVKRFPDVNIINKWPLEAFKDLKTDSSTALIALTHDPKIDDPALKHALKNKFFYIGALGSKSTHLNRCQRLREAGFKEEEINSIHGPIGIKLGGKSAPEIALSIIAQLVSETYKS